MGQASRKKTLADLHGAQRHCDAALRTDPRHPCALEHSGELALMKGDLQQSITRYKTNGNRY